MMDQPYYVAQDWNQWETGQFLIDAMGDNYTKVEPFSFPLPPQSTRRKSEPGGGTGTRNDTFGGEEEEEHEGGGAEDDELASDEASDVNQA